jgi:hypothetical protein
MLNAPPPLRHHLRLNHAVTSLGVQSTVEYRHSLLQRILLYPLWPNGNYIYHLL